MRIVNIKEAAKALTNHLKNGNGRVFSACFVKRSDGTERVCNGRFNVTAHLKGGESAYSPSDYKLVRYYDTNSAGYRSIPLDGLKWVQVDGEKLVVA
jgi:hypothetical protein